MTRRGRTSSPFSLFSFQDIITSVTAIIILITLMLTVELLNRQMNAAPPDPAESVEELRQAIAEAQRQIDELSARLTDGTATVDELASATTEQLRIDIADLQVRFDALSIEVRRLTAQAAAARAAEQKVQADRFDRQADQARLAELNAAADAARDKVARLRAENRLIFNPTTGAAKRAWLIDVSGASFRVGIAGRGEPVAEFDQVSVTARVDALARWAADRNAAAEYFVLLIRPTGIDGFQSLSERLEKMGFDIGFDLLSANMTVLDPPAAGPVP